MKVSVVTRKDFNLSPRQLLISSRKELENILTSFNHTEGNNSYYFLDYYRQEIVVSSLSAPILGGFSKALADQEGFDFFERILSNKEWNWMSRVNVKMYEFFFSCPEADRKHLAFAYDLKITTIKGKQIILSHIIVPYKLCKNGNLWLGLCQVSVSPNHKSGCPTIYNRRTGEQYTFIDNELIRYHNPILTDEELMVLEWMIKGLSDKQICEHLNNMPITNFKRKKRTMYDKLQAGTAAEAIYKAHRWGVI